MNLDQILRNANMTDSQKMYLKYAMEHRSVRRDDVTHRVLDMPSCPKCSRVALRHRNGVRCPVCGYEGPAGPKIRLLGKEV